MGKIRTIIREELESLGKIQMASEKVQITISIPTIKDNLEAAHLIEIKSIIDSGINDEEKLAKISAIVIWWSNQPI